MPKEVIYPQHHGTSDHPTPWAELHWHREAGVVQLAVVAADGMKLDPESFSNGWFADLDRHGINHLIRALRRARDQAFGKDE